jgi:hexosaminidase
MLTKFQLLPEPRQVEFLPVEFTLPARTLILLDGDPQLLRFAASRVQDLISTHFNFDWQTTASWAVPLTAISLTLRLAADEVPHPQGYQLSVTPAGITIKAHDPAGIFYGVCTLNQILSQLETPTLPGVHILDWPDFPARGVMLDISRDKVYTQQTLYDLVDLLASWKYNQLQLYTEHTFAYQRHPKPWANASPMTGQEILELDAYCRQRQVELVPNQNAFGHMARWLNLDDYAHIAETTGEFPTPWGIEKGPFSLAPEHPGSLALVRELLDELLPHFSSRMVNVGADETHDIGHGQSRDSVAKLGEGRVYLNFLLKLYEEVSRRGFTMQFWGDIVNLHPELVPELPRDMIAMPWGYEADHPFDIESARMAAAGLPFYVCPGTSTWTSLAGRTTNALGNLLNAAENGKKYGAAGYLNTDWGDRGHWQVLPVSYMGFAAGAAYSWSLETNRAIDLPSALSLHAFKDPSGVMGRLAYDLGNVYTASPIQIQNGTIMFWALQWSLEDIAAYPQASTEPFDRCQAALDKVTPLLGTDRMTRPDAELVRREFANTIRLMQHACRRGSLAINRHIDGKPDLHRDMQEIITEYEKLWLARNRPGGLKDSVARLRRTMADYEQVTGE